MTGPEGPARLGCALTGRICAEPGLSARVLNEKPASFALSGSRTRSETGYAEASHTTVRSFVGTLRSTPTARARVLVTGFEPARAFAQRCEKPLRLPVSPHQHLTSCEPWQARRPRRETSNTLPLARTRCGPGIGCLVLKQRVSWRNHAMNGRVTDPGRKPGEPR